MVDRRHRCGGPGPRRARVPDGPPTGTTLEASRSSPPRPLTLIEVITQLRHKGEPFVCSGGTLICTDPVAARTKRGNHSWYAGLAQGLRGATSRSSPTLTGFPVWVWPVEPGSTHDLTAARTHTLPALYKAASQGTPTLADKGHQGAGIGALTPVKGARPCPDDATYHLHAGLRSPAERANAMLKHFKALQHVTLDPHAITHITTTALVIINLNKQPRRERRNVYFDSDNDPSGLRIFYDPKDFTGEFRINGVRTFAQIKASVPTTPASIDGVPGEGFTSFYNGWSFLVWRYPDGALLVIKFFTKDSGPISEAIDLTGPALEVGKIVAPKFGTWSHAPQGAPHDPRMRHPAPGLGDAGDHLYGIVD